MTKILSAPAFVARSNRTLVQSLSSPLSLLVHLYPSCSRYFSSSSDPSSNGDPLGTINGAIKSLQSFTLRLQSLSETIRKEVVLTSGQSVTLRDITLHSRDAKEDEFVNAAAVAAREEIAPLAEVVEREMSSMAHSFVTEIGPLMNKAASICKETPCGGATWQLAEEGKFDQGQSVEEEFLGSDTPCGKLEATSRAFIKLTNDTREDAALGSRAALILRLAKDHNAPLVEVRKSAEGREALARTFNTELIPTPWIKKQGE